MKSTNLSAALRSGRAPLRPVVAGVTVLTLAVSIGLAVGPAQAVHDEGFELDANQSTTAGVSKAILANGAVDWVSLFDVAGAAGSTVTTKKATLPAPIIEAGFKKDWVLPDASGYATGSKDTLPMSASSSDWQCKTPNNLGSKFDLVNAYAAAAVPTSGAASGNLIVYFGSEVSAPEGNRNMGLWLLQDPNVGCQGTGNMDFSGSHVHGDVFIVSAFTNGGSQANIDVYEWVDTSSGDNDADVGGELQKKAGFTNVTCPNTNSAITGPPAIPADAACAVANTDGDKTGNEPQFDIDPAWDAPDKDGGNLNEAQFLEGGVDLTALGLSGCFSTFLANSRSSQETTSTLHDFAIGQFNTCGKLRWLKHDGDGNLLGGATFSVCGPNPSTPPTATDCVSVVDNAGQTGYTGLDTDAAAGVFELVNLQPGTYTIRETAAPPGYQLDPDTESVVVTRGGTAQPTTAFVNPGLYKLIILTCNTATEKLVDSTVDLDGNPATTNDKKETLYVSPSNPNDSRHGLCATGGAVYDDLAGATYTPSVELPDVSPFFPVDP